MQGWPAIEKSQRFQSWTVLGSGQLCFFLFMSLDILLSFGSLICKVGVTPAPDARAVVHPKQVAHKVLRRSQFSARTKAWCISKLRYYVGRCPQSCQIFGSTDSGGVNSHSGREPSLYCSLTLTHTFVLPKRKGSRKIYLGKLFFFPNQDIPMLVAGFAVVSGKPGTSVNSVGLACFFFT